MKSNTTPRTLADSSFTTGYQTAYFRRRYDVTVAGHRAVLLVSVVGLVGVVGAILLGVL